MIINELHAVGGGARSPLWLQLKADICQVPLRVPQVTEAACLGAALLAGTTAGVYASITEAARATIVLEQRITPDETSVRLYEQRYNLYKEVYPTLASLLHRI